MRIALLGMLGAMCLAEWLTARYLADRQVVAHWLSGGGSEADLAVAGAFFGMRLFVWGLGPPIAIATLVDLLWRLRYSAHTH